MRAAAVALCALAVLSRTAEAARDPAECEVCVKVVNDVAATLKPADKKDIVRIEEKISAYCAKPPTEKDGRLVRARSERRVCDDPSRGMRLARAGKGGGGVVLGRQHVGARSRVAYQRPARPA